MPYTVVVSYQRFGSVLLASSGLKTEQRKKTFPHMREKWKNGYRAVGRIGEEGGLCNGW